MDNRNIINVAKEYAIAVNSQYNVEKMILFGSFAKGNFHSDSDIDIAVIFNDFESLNDIQLALMKIRRQIDSRIEPHPFRKKDFNHLNPLAFEIMKYGQII